jgi:hypothetical protein
MHYFIRICVRSLVRDRTSQLHKFCVKSEPVIRRTRDLDKGCVLKRCVLYLCQVCGAPAVLAQCHCMTVISRSLSATKMSMILGS